jgi:hypothetical protein
LDKKSLKEQLLPIKLWILRKAFDYPVSVVFIVDLNLLHRLYQLNERLGALNVSILAFYCGNREI